MRQTLSKTGMDSQLRSLDHSVVSAIHALEELRREVDFAFAQTKDAMRLVERKSVSVTDASEDHQTKLHEHVRMQMKTVLDYGHELASYLSNMRLIIQHQASAFEASEHKENEVAKKSSSIAVQDDLKDVAGESDFRAFLAEKFGLLSFPRKDSLLNEDADSEQISDIFDWATEALGRTVSAAEEAVAHRRVLLREMSLIEQRVNDTQAQTARTLEKLISG
jgi:hypothetical protein